MDHAQILRHVDHTLLKATACWADIQALCEDAIAFHTACVCIPASYVGRIYQQYGDALPICTVIGFPLGYEPTPVKVLAAREAIHAGAQEIDMVVNLTDVKNGDFSRVREEIAALRRAAGKNILKVIVEACYLDESEKIALCKCVSDAGADFIKTSTGFGTGGATLEDVRLFKAHIAPGVQIKAAGGIRTFSEMEAYLAAGCTRIGASVAVQLYKEELAGK